jgi:outer membrane biogenesis lipoprotein LolB
MTLRWVPWLTPIVFVTMLLSGCGGRSSEPSQSPTIDGASWREAQRSLQELRETFAPDAGTMRVAVRFVAASKDLQVSGRGAVARRPPDDLRMILVGPGGMTALDLLVRGDAWWLAIPSRDRVLHNEEDGEEARGLPVTFLRWWLLRPLSGRLLSVSEAPTGRVFVLRERDATIRVQRRGEGLVMDRKSPSGTERMSVSGPGCGTAVYEHVDARIRAEVRCEAEVGGVDPEMFRRAP